MAEPVKRAPENLPLDSDPECSRCGYPLRGLDERKMCPECGFPVVKSMPLPRLAGCDLHELRPVSGAVFGWQGWARLLWAALVIPAIIVLMIVLLMIGTLR